MTTVRLRRVPETGRYSPDTEFCGNCSGCGNQPIQIALPDESDLVELTLAQRDQVSLLWHSLIQPLVALVLVVIVCESAGTRESITLLLACTGFILGLAACRTRPGTLLRMNGESS